MKKLFEWISLFESNLSAAEWAWRIITVAVVVAGGTTTGLLAKGSDLFRAGGLVSWVAVGLFSALLIALILFLVKAAHRQAAEAEYARAFATQYRGTNPLQDSFKDQVIRIEDLRLPGKQLHENKHFKNCQFVGPGAIAILGGTYLYDGFIECGDIVVLPDKVWLTGIVVLKNCTVEHCQFHRITVFAPAAIARTFQKHMETNVAGLPEA